MLHRVLCCFAPPARSSVYSPSAGKLADDHSPPNSLHEAYCSGTSVGLGAAVETSIKAPVLHKSASQPSSLADTGRSNTVTGPLTSVDGFAVLRGSTGGNVDETRFCDLQNPPLQADKADKVRRTDTVLEQQNTKPGPQQQQQRPAKAGSQQNGSRVSVEYAPLPKLTADRVSLIPAEELLAGVELGKRIGRGAFASVYKGSFNCSIVAVKVMLTKRLNSTAMKEILVTPELSHPHIVQTLVTRCARLDKKFLDDTYFSAMLASQDGAEESGETESGGTGGDRDGDQLNFRRTKTTLGSILIHLHAKVDQYVTVVIMEHCDKDTLQTAIARGVFIPGSHWDERLARRALVRSLAELASGLKYLHAQFLMHGDFKPSNVLLKGSKQDRRGFSVKIADFGLAHLMDCQSEVIDTPGWGTVRYMAPEHFANKLGKPADVYSFGMVMWEMMRRQRPYQHLSQGQIVTGVMSGALRPEWPADDFAELSAIGLKCVATDPLERPTFKQVETMLYELEQKLRTPGTESGPCRSDSAKMGPASRQSSFAPAPKPAAQTSPLRRCTLAE